METLRGGVNTVAKVQKSLLLNEDLVKLIDAQGKFTGASFTRIMTAAVIQYFFSDPIGPDTRWMECAVEIENGETKVGDLPKSMIALCEANALRIKKLYGDDNPNGDYECAKLRNEINCWKAFMYPHDTDDIEHIIALWSEFRKGKPKNFPNSPTR